MLFSPDQNPKKVAYAGTSVYFASRRIFHSLIYYNIVALVEQSKLRWVVSVESGIPCCFPQISTLIRDLRILRIMEDFS